MKTCKSCHVPKTLDAFYGSKSSPDGVRSICKDCWRAKAPTPGGLPPRTRAAAADGDPAPARAPRSRRSIDSVRQAPTDTGYVANSRLLGLWDAVQAARVEGNPFPPNIMFLGPSGCGKTVAAEHLALVANLPFTKVDAAAMTDPESWFGTREIVAVNGVAVTTYRPSAFVVAIEQAGVVLIDEVNRIRDEHRNILLPLVDSTGQVTNPLTGETVRRHPECYIIMSGNRGLQFTGTYPVDPALMTRSVVEVFDYLPAADEVRIAAARTGADDAIAALFVRFANETRTRARQDPDMAPVSTREVLVACALVAKGLDVDDAAVVAIMNGVSDEGGVESIRHRLQTIWTGIRPAVRQQAFAARS